MACRQEFWRLTDGDTEGVELYCATEGSALAVGLMLLAGVGAVRGLEMGSHRGKGSVWAESGPLSP